MRLLPLLFFLALSPFSMGLVYADKMDDFVKSLSFQAPVIDRANILPRAQKDQINQLARKIQSDTGVQIGVVTIPSLEGHSIEGVSIQIADKWKLGSAKDDNGVLLLIALQDRKMRIEVGQGLEGSLTDAYSKRINDQILTPRFRNGQYGEGIAEAMVQMMQHIDPGYTISGVRVQRSREPSQPLSLLQIIFSLGILIFLIFTRLGRMLLLAMIFSGRGGYRGGGGSSGGYSGGGGGFSGGGSSGSW